MDIIKKIDLFVEANDNEKLAAADKKIGGIGGFGKEDKKKKKLSQDDSETQAPK